MKQGLLWYDNDPRKSLDEKIAQAARRYREKFGAAPNICYVNPACLNGKRVARGTVRVVGARTVLPNHFWLEVEK